LARQGAFSFPGGPLGVAAGGASPGVQTVATTPKGQPQGFERDAVAAQSVVANPRGHHPILPIWRRWTGHSNEPPQRPDWARSSRAAIRRKARCARWWPSDITSFFG